MRSFKAPLVFAALVVAVIYSAAGARAEEPANSPETAPPTSRRFLFYRLSAQRAAQREGLARVTPLEPPAQKPESGWVGSAGRARLTAPRTDTGRAAQAADGTGELSPAWQPSLPLETRRDLELRSRPLRAAMRSDPFQLDGELPDLDEPSVPLMPPADLQPVEHAASEPLPEETSFPPDAANGGPSVESAALQIPPPEPMPPGTDPADELIPPAPGSFTEPPPSEPLPFPPPLPPEAVVGPRAEPLFDEVVIGEQGFCDPCRDGLATEDDFPPDWFRERFCDECSPWKQLFAFRLEREPCPDIGIGHERVMFAPFAVDTTQPLNNFRVRFDNYYGMVTPDRAEYFWARPPLGPPFAEESVDWQDIRFILEAGGPRFSLTTEVPIRIVDPVINEDTSGLGDIVLYPKVLLLDGRRWQLSHIFRTYLKTGDEFKGVGNGHVSLEPGMALRYKWTERTYCHWELRYWFPAGSDPDFGGEVLRYGFAMSTVAYETDTFAVLPTLEFVGWSVLDGLKTLPPPPALAFDSPPAGVDGESFLSIYPGVRFVLGPAGDLGLFELGITGAFNTSNNGFFDHGLVIEARFSY